MSKVQVLHASAFSVVEMEVKVEGEAEHVIARLNSSR
jgi:hypothetical protein